ncbi:MAG TPA: redoxin domain-containing protein [Pirellulaceae bacterium]|nr:redoxin domain-containing protein [Pirellulaceae bacterium]HMO94240.1 redoxin domain-containing protein [Pirellulaceae bacterium]HMP70805.1 redoxin domain-containing protein [Pirellulaceae bacterium]
MNSRPPRYGEPAPYFECRSPVNPNFHFDTVAGRYLVLCFYGSSLTPIARETLNAFLSVGHRFDDVDRAFFAVSTDEGDEAEARVREHLPGLHLLWDFDQRVSRLFGCFDQQFGPGFQPQTFVLDERLRVVARLPFADTGAQHVEQVLSVLNALPDFAPPARGGVPAPVLVVPRIFEPKLCQALIDYYETSGGEESGFVRDVEGKTVVVHDFHHKRRRDQEILDEQLREACVHRLHDRLVPEIKKAFQFQATRIERYIVACYESQTGGHFRAHRDNTTKGTAHRKFAVSLNLNTGQYQGGQVWFPEFGRQVYEAPAGGAVVFSCSLLHEATPVTAGKRYVFLPFLYDDEGAKIREQNAKFVNLKQSKTTAASGKPKG